LPLRLRIARGGDAGAGTLGVRNFRGLGPGGWPPRPSRSPATRPEAPGDFLTHKRTRHGAPGARARPPGAPVRFRTGLDWSGLWQVSANPPSANEVGTSMPMSRVPCPSSPAAGSSRSSKSWWGVVRETVTPRHLSPPGFASASPQPPRRHLRPQASPQSDRLRLVWRPSVWFGDRANSSRAGHDRANSSRTRSPCSARPAHLSPVPCAGMC
jgi:hypothetical protein